MTDIAVRNKSRRNKIGVVVLALILISAAIAGSALRTRGLPKRFAVVEAGVLYRSSQPKAAQLQNVIDDYGIKTLVIAREGTGRRVGEELDFARKHGLRVVHIPIESRQPITEEQVKEFLRCVDDPQYRPVLVHCSAGRHRTGYLCGLFRVERQGWTVAQAVEEMLSFGAAEGGPHPLIEQLKQYKPGQVATPTSKPAGA
jgi:tyrosine-protein phosphatase SIW14